MRPKKSDLEHPSERKRKRKLRPSGVLLVAFLANAPLVFFAGLATKCPVKEKVGHEKVGSIGQQKMGTHIPEAPMASNECHTAHTTVSHDANFFIPLTLERQNKFAAIPIRRHPSM